MPKKFAPPTKEHPAGSVSSADPLCDLLWGSGDQKAVAAYLRDEMDEPNSRLMAVYLQLIASAVPVFRRALIDGEGAALKKFEAADLLNQLRRARPTDFSVAGLAEHRQMISDAEADVKRFGLLASAHDLALSMLSPLAAELPVLMADPRSEQLAKTATLDQVSEFRTEIQNWMREHKLTIDVVDGWPRSQNKRYAGSDAKTVRLVTISEPGMRNSR